MKTITARFPRLARDHRGRYYRAALYYEVNPPSTPEESSMHKAVVYLYQGYYSTIEEVVTSLKYIFNNLKTGQKLDRVPAFEYNSRKRKIYIELQPWQSLFQT